MANGLAGQFRSGVFGSPRAGADLSDEDPSEILSSQRCKQRVIAARLHHCRQYREQAARTGCIGKRARHPTPVERCGLFLRQRQAIVADLATGPAGQCCVSTPFGEPAGQDPSGSRYREASGKRHRRRRDDNTQSSRAKQVRPGIRNGA